MTVALKDLEWDLRKSKNEWRWYAAKVINRIPKGLLATYGTVAMKVNDLYGLQVNARNIAWLRSHLYHLTNRDTSLPLHRLAKEGDDHMLWDSKRTRREGMILRRQEESHRDPKWWKP